MAAWLTRVLFVCSQNRLRSPTAEAVFASFPGITVASAGLDRQVEKPVTDDLIDWADVIFVMQKSHLEQMWGRFRGSLEGKKVICLDIPDNYEYMEPDLVELLQKKVTPHLG
jgi:predicted protein tyrosine phosphatase